MRHVWSTLAILLLLTTVALPLTGCAVEEEGPMEEAGEAIDEAVDELDGEPDSVGEAVEETVEETAEEVKEGVEEIEEAGSDG